MTTALAETFSTGQVRAITGATARQLDWWDWTKFVSPSGPPGRRRRYTFGDILKIRTMVQLRRRGYSLPFLRRVMDRLQPLSGDELASVRLVDVDGELYLCRDWREVERATDGQLVWSVIAFGEAAKKLRQELGSLLVAGAEKRGRPPSRRRR